MEKVVRGGGRAEARRENLGVTCDRDSKNLCRNPLFAFGIAELSNYNSGQISPGTVSRSIHEF
jgi:hypothetical protein